MTIVHEPPYRPEAATPSPPPAPPWPNRFRRVRWPGRPAARARRPPSLASSVFGWASAGLAVLLAWFICYALVLSSLQASHSQGVLYSKLR